MIAHGVATDPGGAIGTGLPNTTSGTLSATIVVRSGLSEQPPHLYLSNHTGREP